MAEYAHIHRAAVVQIVQERYIVDEILREVFVGVGVGGIVAADYNLEAVVEERFRYLIAVAGGLR